MSYSLGIWLSCHNKCQSSQLQSGKELSCEAFSNSCMQLDHSDLEYECLVKVYMLVAVAIMHVFCLRSTYHIQAHAVFKSFDFSSSGF